MSFSGADGAGSPRIRPFLASRPAAPPAETDAPDDADDVRLRPFVLTGGRVIAHDPDIDLHTQVTARARDPGELPPEQRAMVELCAEPLSVAEISARLRLHLGVTKILVSDLRAAGYLEVHALDAVSPHDPETILRVINGLRAFT